ncbi:Lrp/AsnC family transcriptional regulator [Halobacterium wangiae]|uniref:Lrp/AsnC family transcriptional regulator n=1 Tax=Halobacterium wangiae TaxID=2902623 RepID=UPI001E538E1A|nr:Lrp/AsnC family transcriptional regulator [Halobacterium wangiae]
MEPPELDDVDRGILHMLQADARNNTASVIAEAVGVAPNTVRNRIERLEDDGVINGYQPDIDYDAAGFQLRVQLVCTVSIGDRAGLVEEALGIDGVVEVEEIHAGTENLVVEAVAGDGDDITRIAANLEALGLAVQTQRFVKNVHVQPFDHFGSDVSEE